MTETLRIVLLLAIAGVAATLLGSAAAWWRDEARRLNRQLRRALGAAPDMALLARGRGLAAGFSHAQSRVAVLWDGGARGLIYRLDQLVGAELIVDDRVEARAFRDEPRRALDMAPSQAARVLLRLVFDSPTDPDFELPLWPPADPARIGGDSAPGAIQAARRWVSSVEAIVRQPRVAGRPAVAAPPQPAANDKDEESFADD